MSAEFLLIHFDRLAEAPDGIAKLRALVLQLAITGKLLTQSKADEPATKLLVRIRTEIARITKKPVISASVDRSEVEVAIPAEWEWIKLGDLCSKTGSGSTPRGGKTAYTSSGIPFLRSQNVYDDGLRLDGVAYITPEIHAQMSGTAVVPGDLLLNITGGSIGRCAVVPGFFTEGNVSQHVAILRPAIAGMSGYLHLVVLSPLFQTVMLGSQTGAGREGLPKNRMDEILIPLPPLAEQRRIVAKVEELMGLCDALEAAQQEREAVRTRLRTSALHQLASPDSNPRSTFVPQHLPLFTNVPEDLFDVRQCVLQLAILGQLATNDLSDESASTLLRKIEAEKARLMKARKIRQQEPLPGLNDSERPFDIPSNWVWTRLGSVGDWGSGSTPARGNSAYYGGETTWLKSGELNDCLTLHGSEEKVTEAALKDCSFRFNQPGDVLMAMYGATIGKLAILAEPAVTNQAVCGCTPFPGVLNRYLFLYLLSRRADFHSQSEGGAQPNISKIKIVMSPIPLPPLAEQRRIVAKVDEVMAVLDALEATLTTARATSERLLAATIARLSEPAGTESPALMAAEDSGPYGDVVKIPGFTTSLPLMRATLAAEIVQRMHGDRTFGQIKLQKVIYLAEYIAQLDQIDSHPERYQNGPHDPELIVQVEAKLSECGWFEAVPRTGGPGSEYRPLAQAGEHQNHFENLWPKQIEKIRHLIDEMKSWKTERCERFATLYAAWNDLIIWGKPTDDAAVLDQVLNHWHTAKQSIPKSSWQEMLVWMKREGYTPIGWGRATATAPQAEFFST